MGGKKVWIAVIVGLMAVSCGPLMLGIAMFAGGMGGGSGGGQYGALDGSRVPQPAWAPWIEKAGSLCPEVPPPIIAAQIEAESNWNPQATSSAGAQGLTQFMPGTWASYGKDVNGNGVSVFDPPDAIMAQGHYMCDLVSQIKASKIPGDVTALALAGYNAGFGNVLNYGGIPPFSETQKYVPKILGLTTRYSIPTAYGGTGSAKGVIQAAMNVLGKPYVWGGGGKNGPTGSSDESAGFDCSGLMQYAFWQGARVDLPRTTTDMMNSGKPVPFASANKNTALMQPGDMIVFIKYDTPDNYSDHVGLYIGEGKMIHAPQQGQPVQIAEVGSYWQSYARWYVRRLV